VERNFLGKKKQNFELKMGEKQFLLFWQIHASKLKIKL
jgi:hypothetical protein